MKNIKNLTVGLDETLEEKLAWLAPGYTAFRVRRQSLDARKRHAPHWVYAVDVFEAGETPPDDRIEIPPLEGFSGLPVLIVGAGPAGLFAALRLIERGIPCRVFEQGSVGEKRIFAINRFWRYGELDPRNNVCFGEGGAGLYSDGKLITRIKSPFVPYVMERLVRFGAPAEIRYLSNPHVGSDRLRRVIPKMRDYLREKGVVFHFDTKVAGLCESHGKVTGLTTEDGQVIPGERVVLACGHSAEDLFLHLRDLGVALEGKSFAVGLRIEHPQAAINQIQFREAADDPRLGSAQYKLTHHDHESGVGVYSFCMCPGGYVLSSGTESDGMVCNGMSNYRRNSPFANSALVVSIDHDRHFGDDLWGGLRWRREIEKEAYLRVKAAGGQRQLPAQRLLSFLAGESGPAAPSSTPSGVVPVRLDKLLPDFVHRPLVEGLKAFEGTMKGFVHPEAQLHGVESRTSCPLRMPRDPETLQSISHAGLYPAGEGAGYAGGITSAACDGIRIAEAIYEEVR